jgi:hypothetical protein
MAALRWPFLEAHWHGGRDSEHTGQYTMVVVSSARTWGHDDIGPTMAASEIVDRHLLLEVYPDETFIVQCLVRVDRWALHKDLHPK